MSEKPYRIRRDEAASGDLPVPGGRSTFRILLDEESVGAKEFALLVNEFDPGLTSKAHKHDNEEHGFYIMSGTGVIRIEEERLEVSEGDAVFVPPGKMHEISSTGDAPLKYIVIYSPPGPNVALREKGAYGLAGE
ncbi:MAG: cupin domain-containing protein [Nitrospinaceae bacterium]|jgi:mannose-6-phosphate isomerase-like protein (cupin superfamily)|nr:cupin domain-containing protein [Nitrospinaceae bacterium]MBT3434843.1 cupin domain-containing protein [Nitrospinaceae bacterium]MBT3823207.1 cupin domain-containing protein [Nitrospinaceae bacterium]MBT4092899.1 cupin domain-containing protein [Nitrospinaceae bacterium]MBT4429876.1 cupin domain-containing protein [Nitrospinaceae bacterium]